MVILNCAILDLKRPITYSEGFQLYPTQY